MTDFDPRIDVGALSDEAPMVLLPLRLETRFRQGRLRPRRFPELCVRVFPDDCWIDTFTAELTETEFESARRYWRSRLSSPDEQGVREAWRTLVTAHGAGRASYLIESWQPTSPAEVDAADPAAFPRRETSWSAAARLRGFPQRLRLVGVRGGVVELDELGELIPDPLMVGPDPSAPVEAALRIDDDGQLVVPDELRWLVDYSAAVKVGMAFRVRLTADQVAGGFDRLFVLGVRVGGDHHDGAKALTGLIERHRWSSPGFELLPQGRPTNNTDGAPSAFRRFDDPDVTFAAAHRTAAPAVDPADWRHKPDGQWFSELLGLEPEVAKHLVNAEATDQIEGRAMSRLLWPATLGYYLDAMLASSAPGRLGDGVLSRRSESTLRDWATRYVVGRGALPAIRIGRQPYGLVTTTAFSRLSWTTHGPAVADNEQMPFVAGLHRTVEVMRRDWMAMTSRVAHLAGSGDVAERLALVLGLQPSSVQFHQRHADSADRQTVLLGYISGELMQRHRAFVASMADASMEQLKSLGANLSAPPEVLTKLFVGGANRLDGPVVDDLALSETDGLRVDYLAWLHKAASTSLDMVRSGEGLDPRPRALLFLLAKFALERAYGEVADDLLVRRGGADPAAVLARRVEPAFVHLAATGASESRWRPLYEPAPRITSDDRAPLHRFISNELRRGRLSASGLGDQLDALESLRVPTARLERAFVEHLDTCGYRLDAWLGGLVGFQLQQMRFPVPTRPPRVGAHLGAYGWLENVRPRQRPLEGVTITDPDVAETFRDPANTAVMSDPTNGGFVTAPTLDHAATAAVLRAGYLSVADPANPGPLAVNLSSDRVRRAQYLLEGVRAGQSLGALLGYQLERGLHDHNDLPQLHTAIYALRLAFPLRANRLGATAAVSGEPAEVVEARNVVDGVRLCDHVRAGGALPPMAAALAAAVSGEVDRLFDVYDAVSDLALAEGVHQLVLGNHERAAAMLDAFGRSGLPSEPDVIRAPRNGFAITHRLVLHLDPDAAPGPTPRSAAAPGIDAWLTAVLPPADRVGCLVRAVHPESGAVIERIVTQADLGWQAIDLLMHLDVEADQLMSTLDDGVVDHVVASLGLRADAQLSIDHTAVVDGHATFFQMAPVMRNLRSLLLKPTVLRPTDLMAPGEMASAEPIPSLERSRVAAPLAELSELRAAVIAALAAIDADFPAAIDDIDGTVASVLALSGAVTRFGIGTGGSGQLRAAFGQVFGEIVATVATTASGIVERLARFDLGLAAFDALPASSDAATRLDRLVELERLVSTVATSPLPAVAAMRATLVVKRGVLSARRGSIAAAAIGHIALRPLLTSVIAAVVDAAPSLAELVGETPDLTGHEQAISALADAARRQLVAMLDDVDQRMIKAVAALAAFDSAVDPTALVDALTVGGRALFGDAFPMVPTLTLPPDRSAALGVALASSGGLTAPLVAAGRDDPVEDWFHGVARVRERVQSWETVVMLTDPLRRRSVSAPVSETDLGLAALQFPHIAGAPWMALELPPGTVPSADTLCYTFVGTIPDATRVSGIVIDDWSEVISLPERTAGLAVHFDGPNSEPPQAWLVVTPATWDGSWQWDDLVTALGDTLDLARLRAVEPDHIDDSRYAPLLPATVLPVAPFQISIVANLATNLERFSKFRED